MSQASERRKARRRRNRQLAYAKKLRRQERRTESKARKRKLRRKRLRALRWARRWLDKLRRSRYYRFGQGRVTYDWLWLLTVCKAGSWDGTLGGRRTGLRSYAMQLSLWLLYKAGRGAPAYPPWADGRHMIRTVKKHGGWYQAVDTSDVDDLIDEAAKHGVKLRRPYSYEPWHVEAIEPFRAPEGWKP